VFFAGFTMSLLPRKESSNAGANDELACRRMLAPRPIPCQVGEVRERLGRWFTEVVLPMQLQGWKGDPLKRRGSRK
jgi:hypothetical protein